MKLTLKIKLFFIICALLSTQTFAQLSTYTFSSSAGTYIPITGTTLFGGGWDDGASILLNIPFTFNYNNVNYTMVSVGANGFITLGTQAINQGYCGLASGMFNSIAGYCTDLKGSPTSSILYTTRGVSPNRQFVAQWTDCDHWNNSNLNHWTFQIILNETSNAVQVVWGNSTEATFMGPNNCVDAVNESGDVGLIGNSIADFNTRMVTNGVNTWATSVAGTIIGDVCNMSPTNFPASGLTYTWTPLPPSPMVFVSATTTFVNNLQGVARNSTNALLRVEVVTSGTLSPISVSSMNLSTAGSTNAPGDILNAKVYFTGQSNVYSTANQFGTTVNNPNGAYTVNGSATLSFGTNYFWVAYGLTGTATINDSLRGCCTQVTGSGTMGVRTPTVTCPGGYQIITALGYWTPVVALAPDQNGGVCILLTDGTVIAKTSSGSADGIGTIWDKLTPDIHGSYTNGTWSQITPMYESRLYFSSQVMQDGRVYVAGGEYGTGGSLGEVYDPVADTWTMTPPQGQRISDANSEILPDGTILQAMVNQSGPVLCNLYDPANNTYGPAPDCLGSHNESTWVKLPDQSVIMIDMPSTTSERYIPSLNQWIADATVPVDLYDAFGSETGAGLLLPDGRAFFIGSTGHTAYYTPSGNLSPGSWAAGPDIPAGNGQCDAPAAMMVDGKILLTAAPAPVDAFSLFSSPTYFYEYNYLSNTYTQITAPDGSPSVPIACYQTNLLLLPDGNVLYSNQQDTSIGRHYYVYTPAGSPLAAAKPTLATVTQTNCSTYTATGTLFNGLSEGACYGDDWQMATNYPLFRLKAGGNVYYARSFNWNRTDVMTGGLADTAQFTLPVSLPGGDYWLEVVVNGVASDSFLFHPAMQAVSFTGLPDSICTVSNPATLIGNPAGGTFTGPGIAGNVFIPSMAALGNNTITYTYTDSLGCSWSSTHIVNVSICLGTGEIAGIHPSIFVYPNPAENRVSVMFNSNNGDQFKLTLNDLVGRTVISKEGNSEKGKNDIMFALDGIAKGVYTVMLQIGDQLVKTKLAIE